MLDYWIMGAEQEAHAIAAAFPAGGLFAVVHLALVPAGLTDLEVPGARTMWWFA
jgi:hypothetical protein